MFKNALVSVANKDGLVEFIKPLAEKGMRVVSTGGTAKLLQENGISVIKVSEQTGFDEVMDGRVKTLHPRIHMALLARDYSIEDQNTLKEHDLQSFDLVVGNLYAFENALDEGLEDKDLQEFIDIGGPSFLRAAAKSFSQITTVCDPRDYDWIIKKQSLDLEDRKSLAAKLFYHVSSYDSMVARALSKSEEPKSFSQQNYFSLGGELVQTLRYGENPQQQANWYRVYGEKGLQEAEILQGKPLSYNNILDLDAAIRTLNSFQEPTCIAVKHNNPCGVGVSDNWEVAVSKALSADPVSVFGGIVAINGVVNDKMAEQLSTIFLECITAVDFTPGALKIFSLKKNLRLLKAPDLTNWCPQFDFRRVMGGFLIQDQDHIEQKFSNDWKIIGEEPTKEIRNEMTFAMKVCAHLKSNAIAITSQGQSLGLGMGQVNRVDAVEQAILRAKKFHPKQKTMVLASDAFFPFADSVERAAEAGIKWIVQPGGSLRDEEVICAVTKHKMGMVMTGLRHFKH
ncbi:MAG: bifunctional phosphoribosylaminoimidazolecarboxamide formyltransferase/IMP cyclohydrolase [Bdellovibrionaceae bacterium]|nr:bifunctional phosphoribosylaminoimidazolecarboxamide formyltransferase/IMP cyclohydrolase [Pseudobdellovibrionaceae bacterium]